MSLKINNFLFPLLLLTSLLYAEPSAFETQSGATKKDIKNLKDTSLNLSSLLLDVQSRLESLEQVQYGLQSLYDAQNQKMQKFLSDLESQNLFAQETRSRLEVLSEQVEQMKSTQKRYGENLQGFVKILDGLGEKIKELSGVSSNLNDLILKEFASVRAELQKQAEVILKDQENIQKLSLEIEKLYEDRKKIQERNAFKDPNKKAEVLKEAKKMYADKQFEDSRVRFVWLLEQGYKKAEVNYFLGQIAFNQKQYQEAIYYYKESAVANDKASYMPTLMLHTIKSFQALKDEESAMKFIESLLALYPNSKEAKEAKTIQSKIKGVKNAKN
ncbi:tetratricopeptide repeat protein [Helicobacter brantae]|uniref:Uncharacterized protein n=1 Tax=Helicobacter brantae TaxID=375927 RepID=A0A3D8J124_9HELI|nr:hypothetical protein [Helicobacter brantae]RDU71178.1 hypothetical protein CQA58_03430 [Helicobacter brantae]